MSGMTKEKAAELKALKAQGSKKHQRILTENEILEKEIARLDDEIERLMKELEQLRRLPV